MKRNALIALIAVSTAIILPCFAMAYYQITGCPACGSYTSVEYTTGGTGNLETDTDFVASSSWGTTGQGTYRNIAEMFEPIKETRVCAVRSKIQKFAGNFHRDIKLQVSDYGTTSPNWTPPYNLPVDEIITSSSLDFVTPPSSQVPAFAWFNLSPCFTALPYHQYFFEFDPTQSGGGNGKFLTYQTAYNNSVLLIAFAQNQAGSWEQVPRESGNWSFEIVNDLTETQQGQPPATSSYGFTNQDFGLLGNMFRDVIVYLFFPNQDNLNKFGDLWAKIQAKPPIGYFTATRSELANIGTGSASITFDTTAAAGIISPLRTGLIVLLWILFAFWIFHRLRNLDL